MLIIAAVSLFYFSVLVRKMMRFWELLMIHIMRWMMGVIIVPFIFSPGCSVDRRSNSHQRSGPKFSASEYEREQFVVAYEILRPCTMHYNYNGKF